MKDKTLNFLYWQCFQETNEHTKLMKDAANKRQQLNNDRIVQGTEE